MDTPLQLDLRVASRAAKLGAGVSPCGPLNRLGVLLAGEGNSEPGHRCASKWVREKLVKSLEVSHWFPLLHASVSSVHRVQSQESMVLSPIPPFLHDSQLSCAHAIVEGIPFLLSFSRLRPSCAQRCIRLSIDKLSQRRFEAASLIFGSIPGPSDLTITLASYHQL